MTGFIVARTQLTSGDFEALSSSVIQGSVLGERLGSSVS